MNVNLLPEKFIKNRATELIILVTMVSVTLLVIILTFLILFYQGQVTKFNSAVNQAQFEKIQIEKQVTDLQQSQLVELQEEVKLLKIEQKLVEPIMKQFSQLANSVGLTIINYELFLGDAVNQTEVIIGDDGSELLPAISIKLRGDFFGDSSTFKNIVEALEWVYDCKPITITRDNDGANLDYLIRIKKADVPRLSRLEVVNE